MSCDAIALSAMLWLASASPEAAAAPKTSTLASAPVSVAQEPLFADIVGRAGALKAQVEAWKGVTGDLPGFEGFKSRLGELAALDMKANKRLAEVGTAADAKARDNALREMGWLLRDNVEVITTPPVVSSGVAGT